MVELSDFTINDEGQLCKILNLQLKKLKSKELIIQPIIVELVVNALKEDENGLKFLFIKT